MAKARAIHIDCGEWVLCGSSSMAAQVTTHTCKHCTGRLDALLQLLLDAAAGKNVEVAAKELATKLGFDLTTDPEN